MSYGYSFEDLLALLHGHAPAKVDAVALHRRGVEHGHLSVGLKIHCLGDGRQFSTLVEGLGGAHKILDVNYYKHSHASLCLVLPLIAKLDAAVVDTLADPSVRQRLTDLGQEIWPREQQTPEALGALQKAEIEKWWPIIKAANIKAE